MKRAAGFYLGTLLLVLGGIALILHWGADLPTPGLIASPVLAAPSDSSQWQTAQETFKHNANEPLTRLFFQLLIIIGAARGMGALFSRMGQPAVVGEMAAGLLLGPSFFGPMAPGLFQFVFAPESLHVLKLLSQIGVCLFMFAVGMELDISHVRQKAQAAVMVSHASIVFPYFLGVALAYFLYSDLAAPGATFIAFALFLGISLSITAFPVLARILQERKLSTTVLGATALTCAAVDDVTAWSLLAFVVAIVHSTSLVGSLLTVLLALAFVALMIGVVRPGLPHWLGRTALAQDEPPRGVLAGVVCVVVASALATELIGIHALFGAFLAGAIMPKENGFRRKLGIRLENFSSVFLLPLFFAFTGLRTHLGLLQGIQDGLLCLLIIAIATLGKLGASAAAARFTGMDWRDALRLGALMNTRGLMELIALNIGYDLGILSPRIFTMLVLMALATTLLTGPLLTLFEKMPSGEKPAA
jgi:Kef-type K+ transport system membrane component KefB